MKRFIILILTVSIVFSFCSCSIKKDAETTTMYEPTLNSTTESTTDESVTESVKDSSVYSSSTTSTTANNTTETTFKMPETNSDKTTTFYSENPNNRYIKAVAAKYGVDPSCLIALIKVTTAPQGAEVLQFTGERDSKGNLVKTADTLKYIYEVSESGRIKKASGKKTDNDGYSYTESYVSFNLVVKYLIPELDRLKKENTYEDYFKD